MIGKVYYVISPYTDPYLNLALEKTLCQTVPRSSCLLLLWKNASTVVIGKNQNPWAECNWEEMTARKVLLARRESGGGAVYHDCGNLNFTFITQPEDFDIEKQLSVVILACQAFGISAFSSGRNDLIAGGRKFSGSAFLHKRDYSLHHGTVLISTDLEVMEKTLSPAERKLSAKGIRSVRSRVINLRELAPTLSVEDFQRRMLQAFQKVFASDAIPFPLPEEKLLRNARTELQSINWLWGATPQFDITLEDRFPWGQLQLLLQVQALQIVSIHAYSDALDPDLPGKLIRALSGCSLEEGVLIQVLRQAEISEEVAVDIQKLLNTLIK